MTLAFRTAVDLLGSMGRREVSSTELLSAQLSRIEKGNPSINAVVALKMEHAMKRATQADEARLRGEIWGPLHGLSLTVKESFDVQGLATTWGHASLTSNIAARHAEAVQRLENAGAIVFGKTNVPVSLSDWQTFNPVYGTTCNPWGLGLSPGGSSGGAAAALAADFTPLELGSDIGASIRNPAHYCGVYGHKPTWGVIPMSGHQVPGTTCIDSMAIAVAGPMSRSAKDLKLAMSVLASPLQLFGPWGWQKTQWHPVTRQPRQCRVAVVFDDPQARVDAGIQTQLHNLSNFLRNQGVAVVETSLPVDSAQSHRIYMHLLRAATGARLDDPSYVHMQDLAAKSNPENDGTPERTWRGSTLTHRDWVKFDQQRWAIRQAWRDFFEHVDLLITPIATTAAFAHNHQGERWERMVKVNGQDQPGTESLFWAGLAGLPGLPATAVPLGFSTEELPIGAQIVGPWMSDPLCIEMAIWLEENWRKFTPPPLFISD